MNRPISNHSPDGMNAGAEPSGIRRDYTQADVDRLSGSFRIRHTLAEMGAARLRHLLEDRKSTRLNSSHG